MFRTALHPFSHPGRWRNGLGRGVSTPWDAWTVGADPGQRTTCPRPHPFTASGLHERRPVVEARLRRERVQLRRAGRVDPRPGV